MLPGYKIEPENIGGYQLATGPDGTSYIVNAQTGEVIANTPGAGLTQGIQQGDPFGAAAGGVRAASNISGFLGGPTIGSALRSALTSAFPQTAAQTAAVAAELAAAGGTLGAGAIGSDWRPSRLR